MNLPQSIRAQLLTSTAISTTVGTRIKPISAAQSQGNMADTILYRQVGRADEESLNWRPSGVTRWQIAAVSQSYDSAYDLGVAVRACLDGFGTSGSNELGGSGGVRCKIRQTDEFDEEDPESGIFGLIGEYEISEEA